MRAGSLARGALVVAFLLAAGCPTTNKCKDGTVLVTATFDAVARSADRLDVTVQLDQQAVMSASLAGPAGRDNGTIEVQFPHGYHAGSMLQVSITASAGGQTIATGSAGMMLTAGCSTVTVPVTAGGGDGGTDDLSMPDMLILPVPQVTAKPDLVGFTTTLDGSGSSDPLGSALTFAWSVQNAPAGSAITTASLTTTTGTKTAFDPDRGGLYKIALTVTASDGRAGTLVSDVMVPTVPIFYARTSATATTATLGAHVMLSDGTNDHAIGCDYSADGGVSSSTLQAMPLFGHAYEPPSLSTTVPLFVFLGFDPTNPSVPELLVGSAATDCKTTPPTRIDNNVFNDHFPVAARFSPDGKRVVYVDMPQNSNTNTYRLVTTAVDGVGPKHVVRSDGDFGFTPAIWLDNSTVAWLERDTTSSFTPFTIYKAPDENAAGDPGTNTKRTQILRCDPSSTASDLSEINQFEISPFGMIVAGSTSPRATLNPPPLPAVSLYKLADGDCSTTSAKTLAAEPIGGLAWDFSLSPDGLTVLFSSTYDQAIPDGGVPEPQTDIMLVPADGSAAAQKFVGDPQYDDISPRYVAGGRQFVWTRTPRHLDMGADTPAVMIANADGTHIRAFTPAAAPGETVLGTDVGANRGYDCSWIPGSASASATAALFGVVLLLLVAMRPRRR